jgi:enolase
MFQEIQEHLKEITVILKKKQQLNPDDLFCDNQEFMKELSENGDIQWYKYTIPKNGYNLVGFDYYFTDSDNIDEGKEDNGEIIVKVNYDDINKY